MNRTELKNKLDKLGINRCLYSLYGGNEPNKSVIAKQITCYGVKWRVYGVDERGNECEDGVFNSENEACEYLYQEMVKSKWIMDNAHIHPDNKPKVEDLVGFEVTDDGKINAILTDGSRWSCTCCM